MSSLMRQFASFLVILLLLAGCGKRDPCSIEFFTHEGCPYCAKALKYIHINYPGLPIQVLEIGAEENMKKFVKCAVRFKLDIKKLGTPLICMDKHYIMGWSSESREQFNRYIKPYLK